MVVTTAKNKKLLTSWTIAEPSTIHTVSSRSKTCLDGFANWKLPFRGGEERIEESIFNLPIIFFALVINKVPNPWLDFFFCCVFVVPTAVSPSKWIFCWSLYSSCAPRSSRRISNIKSVIYKKNKRLHGESRVLSPEILNLAQYYIKFRARPSVGSSAVEVTRVFSKQFQAGARVWPPQLCRPGQVSNRTVECASVLSGAAQRCPSQSPRPISTSRRRMRSSCAENRTRSRSASSCTTPPKEPSLAAMQRHGVSTERLTSGPPCSNRQWLVVVKNLLTLRRERGLKEFCSRRGAAQGRRNRKLVWLT